MTIPSFSKSGKAQKNMPLPPVYDWQCLSDTQKNALLARPVTQHDEERRRQVSRIIDAVRHDGDAAVRSLTEQYDGVSVTDFRVSPAAITAAWEQSPAALRQALDSAKNRIAAFHRATCPQPVSVTTAPGVVCETMPRPIQRVGLYVPAGSAPLPSTVLMLAVPADIAGCPLKVLVTPPDASGRADPVVLAAAALCGIDRVYLAGGAQAIAALAYGTESFPKVDKIFGPGNAWVTEAKAQVAMDVAGASIDMPAGPSEVLVVADGSAPARLTALDLLSQAEHGPDSQVVLVSSSQSVLEAVRQELQHQINRLNRAAVAAHALQHARFIRVPDEAAMLAVSNAYAPEHLIIQLRQPRQFLAGVTAAGSVFLGPWTPESLGDYCSGTNHVLPTNGYARNHSGLSVRDFMLHISVQQASADGLRQIGPDAEKLAAVEGLDAHRLAVSERLRWLEKEAEDCSSGASGSGITGKAP